jgi:hypothetical protein
MHITEVLNRRADLSTFVVHLTKSSGANSAKENLLSIIDARSIESRSPMGWLQTPRARATVAGQQQRVACFSETPLEHIFSLFADIDDRRVHLEPYGLAFTKMTARRKGVLPVWYVDRTAGAEHQWRIAMALDRLRTHALQHSDQIAADVAAILPHFESMGTWPQGQKEFWWEREWRKVGSLDFAWAEVAFWFAAEHDHREIRDALRAKMNETGAVNIPTPTVLDPSWGLERMMAKLVGLPDTAITPFSQ